MTRLELRLLLDDLKKKLSDVRNDPGLDNEMKSLSDHEWIWLTLMYELRSLKRSVQTIKRNTKYNAKR